MEDLIGAIMMVAGLALITLGAVLIWGWPVAALLVGATVLLVGIGFSS